MEPWIRMSVATLGLTLAGCQSPIPEREATPEEFARFLEGNVEYNVPTKKRDPLYPTKAGLDGTEGTVVVEFDISGAGRTQDRKIVSSDPPGVFDRAVLRAVRDWRFKPIVVDGYRLRRNNMQYTVRFAMYPCESEITPRMITVCLRVHRVE